MSEPLVIVGNGMAAARLCEVSNCGHVGATIASLPRVLICSQCGHAALIRSGRPARSPTVREEQAAERAA